MKIDMQNSSTDRGMLNFLNQGEAISSGYFQFDENVFAGGMTEHGIDVASRNLQRLRFILPAVNDGRHGSLGL